jgi:ABC-type glycerol-3-phosphate transport system substrate-binding protein
LLLAACGGEATPAAPVAKPEPTKAPAPAPTVAAAAAAPTTAPAAPASAAPVTIEIVTRDGVEAPTGHSQFYNAQAKKNFTPASKITVQFVDGKPNAGEKLFTLAAAGTLPDGSWFGVVADGENGREQATKGVFKPLDDLIKQDARFERNIYFPEMLNAFSIGGKLYAVPTHSHYGTNVLYYNKNLTDAAGVKIPDDGNWTIDEFVEAAKKLTKKDADQWGYWPGIGFPEFGAFWVRQFGGEYFDPEGKKVLIDSAEAQAGLEWVYNTIFKHQTIDDAYRKIEGAPLNLTGARGLFAMGKLAMHNTTPGLVAEYKKPGQTEVTFPVGIALFPKGKDGKRGTQASGSGMGLTKMDKQAAVWEWLKFVSNKDNGVEQVFGGAGSPGGRTDVWNDSRLLKERDPIYATVVKAYPQGAGSLRLPANFKSGQVNKAVNDELIPYFQNKSSLKDAVTKAVQQATELLK